MARYMTSWVSQTAQLAGVNSTVTVNGYMGYLGAAASCGFRFRRLLIGMLTTTAIVPISQQVAVALYRQTVAPAGTGIVAAKAGVALESWTPTDPTGGIFAINATTIGTTGPTIGASELATVALNTQSGQDVPWEAAEEIVVGTGTANGLAFVNVGNALPAGHFFKLTAEWEV